MNAIEELVRKGLDDRLPVLRQASAAAQKPVHGWLKAARQATGLSQVEVALRLGTKRQSYAQLESAEARGSVSLNSLERAATALDCEVVYFLVPRESIGKSYADLAARNDPAAKQIKATKHTMALEGQSTDPSPSGK